jgi:predicted transcriptional regulator
MFNLHHVRAQLQNPENPVSASVFRDLIQALEQGSQFDLSRLDSLSYAEFEMAVESIREWRSLRYIQADDPVYSFPLHE